MAFCCFVLCSFGLSLFHFLPSCVTCIQLCLGPRRALCFVHWLHEHTERNLEWEVRLLGSFMTTLQHKALGSADSSPNNITSSPEKIGTAKERKKGHREPDRWSFKIKYMGDFHRLIVYLSMSLQRAWFWESYWCPCADRIEADRFQGSGKLYFAAPCLCSALQKQRGATNPVVTAHRCFCFRHPFASSDVGTTPLFWLQVSSADTKLCPSGRVTPCSNIPVC